MGKREAFLREIHTVLEEIGTDTLSYHENEYWLVQAPYEYVEFYAVERQLRNTVIALHLARGLHDGAYRKSSVKRDGENYRLPYLIHPLLVTRMLIDIQVPLPRREEDILLAASLCHDMIEDIPFPRHGSELTEDYRLDPEVYEIVKLLSKRKDFTEAEERAFFHEIERSRPALLIKLSDRGNNVEDLYNMSFQKIHEYVEETEKYILPMCDYAREHYRELIPSVEILRDKIVCLTETAEILADRYHEREQALRKQAEKLREENLCLRETWRALRDERQEELPK